MQIFIVLTESPLNVRKTAVYRFLILLLVPELLNKLTEISSWMQLHSNADFHFPCFPHSEKVSLNYFHIFHGIREISTFYMEFVKFPRIAFHIFHSALSVTPQKLQ